MNLRELEIFRAIMQGGSITEAARILGISQPAVSTALRHAEDRLGMQLFRRDHGRIEPTPEALSLFPEVEMLFQKFHAIQTYAEHLRGTHAGFLSLAATPTLSYAYVAGAITRFRRSRPNVHIMLDVTNTRRIVELATSRQIDLGITANPLTDSDIATEDLATAELVAVMHKEHPLAKQRVVKPKDVQGYRLITNAHHSLYHILEQIFRRSGVKLDITIDVNHNLTTCLLLQSGDAVAIVDPWMPRALFPDLVRRPLRPKVEIRARLLWANTRPRSRLAEAFLGELRQHVAAVTSDACACG
jgi:DNA-binding transcriptional LysR family regulator